MAADNTCLAVAIYGFVIPVKRIESAGISYECRIVRDKLTLGRNPSPVYKCDSSLFPSTEANEDGPLLDEVPDETAEDRSDWYDADDAKYEKYLMKLNPNDTKNQDHYKVLGLSKLRWKATNAEIRTCYRAKVLRHHPDKKKHRGETLPAGEDYFTCITKAYEQLGMSETKRLAFDSIDHKFDDAIPNEKSITKDNFFKELAPIFDLNSRWSSIKPVPLLGDEKSSRKDVEFFYNFWFDFSSWREFSYLDEEDKERGEDRYERREMEKINKAERERRRKDEAKRIRKLIEMSYGKDPRIAQFKKDDQEAKDRAREEKQRIQREKQEAIDREKREAEAEIERKKEEEEKAAKEKKEREKKEKEVAKKAHTVQKKRLKKLAEDAGHWTDDGNEKLVEMERIERLCLSFRTDELSMLCDTIERMNLSDNIRCAIHQFEMDIKNNLPIKPTKVEDNGKENEKNNVTWSSDEIQVLVKASNTFPSGTVDRWILIADYVNEHRKDKSTPLKTDKQVIKQCKAVQSMNVRLPVATQNQLGASLPDEDNWTPAEQKLLEEGMRKYPSSDPDRWDKISTDVGTKSKKACMRRFKYLAQMIKNNKK